MSKATKIISTTFLLLSYAHISYASDYYIFKTGVETRFNQHLVNLNDRNNTSSKLRIAGKSIIDENNENVYIWGTGLRITKDLLNSTLQEKRRLFKYITDIGFNHIRFVGIDFNDPGFYHYWKKNKKFNPSMSRAICDLISLAKDNNVYYSFGLNHITSKFDSAHANNHSKSNKTLKIVQLYDKNIIRQTEEWFRAILTHKLDGCSHTLASDPANIYLNIVNEDSLFKSFYEQNKHLSEDNLFELEDLYNSHKYSKNSIHIDKSKASFCRNYKKCDSDSRKATIAFLYDLEVSYYTRLKKVIESSGYSGIVTGTNNWYGNLNFSINYDLFDAVNTHVYFDPPRTRKLFNKSFSTIQNINYTTDLSKLVHQDLNHLYRIFSSSVIDKPLIISEWNHTKWSDYSYTGPLLFYTYASLSHVQVADVHTLVPRFEGFRAIASSDPLDVITNPTLVALMPSLSAAFRSGHIQNSLLMKSHSETDDKSSFIAMADKGLSPRTLDKKFNDRSYLSSPMQRNLYGHTGNTTETGLGFQKQFTRVHQSEGKDRFIVFNPHVNLYIGSFENKTRTGKADLHLSTSSSGAISIISLDKQEISESDTLLISIAGNSINSSESNKAFSLGRLSIKSRIDNGHAPVLMRRHKVHLHFKEPGNHSVYALHQNSDSQTKIKPEISGDSVTYSLGHIDTPWYLIHINNMSQESINE